MPLYRVTLKFPKRYTQRKDTCRVYVVHAATPEAADRKVRAHVKQLYGTQIPHYVPDSGWNVELLESGVYMAASYLTT